MLGFHGHDPSNIGVSAPIITSTTVGLRMMSRVSPAPKPYSSY